jgi:hypothetical protein
MDIQINYIKHGFDSIYGTTTYIFKVTVDGWKVTEDLRTFANDSIANKDVPAYFTNFYSKWAYRTHKIENAVVIVKEGKWWD